MMKKIMQSTYQKYAFTKKNTYKNSSINLKSLKFLRSNLKKEGLLKIDFIGNKVIAEKKIKKHQFLSKEMVIIN